MAPEEYRLNADEVACVERMAERFERGKAWVVLGDNQPGQTFDPLELPAERRVAILGIMEDMGLLTDVQNIVSRYQSFQITPKAVQVARTIRQAGLQMQLAEEDRKWRAEQERKDREYRDAQRREDISYRDKRDKEDAEWRLRQERESRRLSNRQLWVAGVIAALAVAVILAATQIFCTWWQIKETRASRDTPPVAPAADK